MKKSRNWRRIATLSFAFALLIAASICYYDLHWRKQRHLLITGCARSGTMYIAKILKRCGYDIGHEQIKKDGASSWEMTVDAKMVPWGDGRNGYRFKHIFHQVRHPLKVISSLYFTEPIQSFEFFRAHIPEIKQDDSRLIQCAKYWYYWNLKVEAQAEWTYRVEELENIWDEFENKFGKPLNINSLYSTPKTTNTRTSYKDITWKELQKEIDPDLYHKIQDLAQKYGYSPQEE